MKRIALVCLVLLGSTAAAHADNDIYNNVTRQLRGDAELQADTSVCSQKLGAPRNGEPTPRAYKRCMLSRGWRFEKSVRVQTWIDPETGLTCHDILGGLGSSCSNF